MTSIQTWIQSNEALIFGIGTASLALLVLTLVALPFVVAQLPEDYFTRRRRRSARKHRKYPFFWAILAIAQNALGIAFVLAGIVLLILPGQGLITILIGLAITNFPGKYAIERRIIRQTAVKNSLNRIRALAGRPALQIPPAEGQEASSGPIDEERPE